MLICASPVCMWPHHSCLDNCMRDPSTSQVPNHQRPELTLSLGKEIDVKTLLIGLIFSLTYCVSLKWEGNLRQRNVYVPDFLSHLWCQLGREVGSCHTWCRCLQSTAGRIKDPMLMFDLSFRYLWKNFPDKFLRQGWVIIDNATALLQHRPEINPSVEKELLGRGCLWK